jgi:hypothetical protein
MTKNRVKFIWEFVYDEEFRVLDVNLNGGNNRGIYIDHPDYYKFLNESLKEIMIYEHIVGNKTEVYGFEDLEKASKERKDEPIEVVMERQLARRGSKA